MGLTLASPIIAGSSSLTSNFNNIKSYADAGVGAVVLKSVFQEQISGEVDSMLSYADSPESLDYLSAYVKENDLNRTINLIKECKEKLTTPIIASINCTSKGEWVEFCKRMEYAGADAIELNIFHLPTSKNESSSVIEAAYLDIAAAVVESVGIPVCVKLSARFTNHLYIVNELYKRGVKGVTMFNRFWEPDFDIEKQTVTSQEVLSNHSEMRSNLRLVGQASAEVKTIDFCASTGVSKWEDVVKFIYAGATTVQLCSALYRDGAHIIKDINSRIEQWMKLHSKTSISDFKGALNSSNVNDSAAYERCQFMKQFGEYK